jgi:membrane protein implicated in regulation of membrane protease activity
MNVNSNEFKALKKTVGFFAIASIAATVFVYASLFIPTQVIIWAILIAMFSLGFWLMYEANLSRLNDEEKRNGE